jgi:hypothetical protein
VEKVKKQAKFGPYREIQQIVKGFVAGAAVNRRKKEDGQYSWVRNGLWGGLKCSGIWPRERTPPCLRDFVESERVTKKLRNSPLGLLEGKSGKKWLKTKAGIFDPP